MNYIKQENITLTVKEIIDLAGMAGLLFSSDYMPDEETMSTEITVTACPPNGILDADGTMCNYAHIAYFTEYPEEGVLGLG